MVACGVAMSFGSVRLAFAESAPRADRDEVVEQTIEVKGVLDGRNKRFVAGGGLGDGGQSEGQKPIFELTPGATLSNVKIGSPAADGVHCQGSCYLFNITWEDVGEDAATFRGRDATVVVDGGSASNGSDKIFQDNREEGGFLTIKNFSVDGYGKLYRSCGNCSKQAARGVWIENVTATGEGEAIAGVNTNLGDWATLKNVKVDGDVPLCKLFEGNDRGEEPRTMSEEPDGKSCKVEE